MRIRCMPGSSRVPEWIIGWRGVRHSRTGRGSVRKRIFAAPMVFSGIGLLTGRQKISLLLRLSGVSSDIGPPRVSRGDFRKASIRIARLYASITGSVSTRLEPPAIHSIRARDSLSSRSSPRAIRLRSKRIAVPRQVYSTLWTDPDPSWLGRSNRPATNSLTVIHVLYASSDRVEKHYRLGSLSPQLWPTSLATPRFGGRP